MGGTDEQAHGPAGPKRAGHMIGLRHLGTWHGPNPLATDPVVVAELTLGPQALLQARAALVGVQALSPPSFGLSVGPAGQQPAAADVGAFLARWCLAALNHVRGAVRAAGARPGQAPDRVQVWLGFHEPQLSLQALALSIRVFESAAGHALDAAGLDAWLDAFWLDCRRVHPDYQAAIVMAAARRRDLPFAPAWGMPRHWRYGQGARSRVLFESSAFDDGHLGARIAASKSLSKTLMQSLGLPTPPSRVVSSAAGLADAAALVGWPCVTKPLDRGGGKGVNADLRDLQSLQRGFAAAREVSAGPVLVEAHVPGEDHRLMVVKGKLVAAIRREPPRVIGDGQRTIRQLVKDINRTRDPRNLAGSGYRRPIVLDAGAQLHLAAQGLSSEAVPQAGQRVWLRSNANLSTGGDCTDVTAQVHPDVRVMVESLSATLHLPTLGADYLTPDIARPPGGTGGQFIEINTTPGLDAMIAAGWTAEDAGDLALGEGTGRIPVVLVVVPAQAAVEGLQLEGLGWAPGAGWATSARVGLGRTLLQLAPTRQPWAAVQCLLSHRAVVRAVVVVTDQALLRWGLPVDRCETAHLLTALPAAWMRVLAQRCGRVLPVRPSAADPQALVSLLEHLAQGGEASPA